MKYPTWIDEKEAAAMLGYKPDEFRRRVKDPDRAMGINFTNTNGRNFRYSKEDIQAFQFRNSTLYKKTA